MVAVLRDVGAVGVRDFPDENRLQAASSPENHVGGAVANHHGVGEIDVGKVVFSLHGHADFGFAAVAPAAGKVRTNVNPVDMHPLFLQEIKKMPVDLVHLLTGADTFGDALLVGDDDDSAEFLDQDGQRGKKVVANHELADVLDIITHQLDVDYAVAIQK